MKLIEHQGKSLYQQHNIPTTNFVFLEPDLTEDQVAAKLETVPGDEVVMKIQILSGKRGKRGGVKIVAKEEAYPAYQELMALDLGEVVFGVMAEEKLDIDQEYYLSLTFDRSAQKVRIIFSVDGGVEIENVPHDKIHTTFYQDLTQDFFADSELAEELLKLTQGLHEMLLQTDAQMIEINPLVVTGEGKLIAADAKLVLDDNAHYRHADLENYETKTGQTEAEKLAQKNDVAYVELDGNIGVIGNGAGLTMATLDYIKLVVGEEPANFLDIGGGAKAEKIVTSLSIVALKKPELCWLNVFGGITSCLEVAKGVIEFKKQNLDLDMPIVVRLMGNDQKKAIELLKENGIQSFETMQDSAEHIKKIIKEK